MTRITEQQWISYMGFERFPFDRPEAGNEEFAQPEFLSTCFVQPRNFERFLGTPDSPVTALMFAARGIGKTACRVMVDFYCQTGSLSMDETGEPNYVLSIPHINLHQVAFRARQLGAPHVQVEHHAQEILNRAMPVFTDLVARRPQIYQAVVDLSPSRKRDLSWLIVRYSAYLNAIQAGFLQGLGVAAPSEVAGDTLLAAVEAQRETISALDHLAQWAELMRLVKIKATYILVDGIDEFDETAGDPAAAFQIVRPMLTSLPLMDGTPHLALKIFLPDSVEGLVRGDSAIRLDRGFVTEYLVWSEDDLIQILRRRLKALVSEAYRHQDRVDVGFDSLCVPELRGQIENDLITVAQRNPRHLMILCGLIVKHHCQADVMEQDDPYQLNRADWDAAQREFAAYNRASIAAPNVISSASALIQQGEHSQLEFKASLRWDYRTQSVNKALHLVIAKAICGLMNASGGHLLIGVQDNGMILGIERDLKSFGDKASLDGYVLALTGVVRDYLGVEQMAFVHIGFEVITEKTVCIVTVQRSPVPVYVRTEKEYEFYVRLGNSSQKLDVKAAMQYIQAHWKQTD